MVDTPADVTADMKSLLLLSLICASLHQLRNITGSSHRELKFPLDHRTHQCVACCLY